MQYITQVKISKFSECYKINAYIGERERDGEGKQLIQRKLLPCVIGNATL